MLKSCQYCSRIHDSKYDCGKKPKKYKKRNEKDKFRSTQFWQIKREEITQRDRYLCQICIREDKYNHEELEVHHAISLQEDFGKRLDNDNLLTLCEKHHEMAEKGKITREKILFIIKEQEDIPPW